jgi:hypothetical protein
VKEWLQMLASMASILTATIAAVASLYYSVNKRSKRLRLEKYLKIEKSKSPQEFRSTTRIMAELGMTEAEILAASFSSRHVKRGVRVDTETGFAAEVLFQYRDTPP